MHYLCSYRPIITTREGYAAVKEHGLPPFIDGSCRREPDFESALPSISSLCRADKFVPRLQLGDTVSYITCKGHHLLNYAHWRLVAIVQIRERFDSHQQAAEWYTSQALDVPSNCMIPKNPPVPFEKTHQRVPNNLKERKSVSNPEQLVQLWDRGYRDRAKRFPIFVACDTLYLNLFNPSILINETFFEIFGRIPGTQNPPKITEEAANRLLSLTQEE